MNRTIWIYVAGKYSGSTSEEVACNIAIARKWSIEIWQAGFNAFCPHLNSAHFEEYTDVSWDEYLDAYLHAVDRCDGVFMIPENWEASTGARIEHDHAKNIGLPVFYDIENMRRFEWFTPWDTIGGGDGR